MKSKENMISQLPNYERDNTIINEIYRVLGDKTDEFLYKIEDLYMQMNIDTATWGLDVWEKNFNINTSNSDNYKIRRQRIKTKMKQHEKVSTRTLENIIQDYYEGEVTVFFNKKLYFKLPLEGDSWKFHSIVKGIIDKTKPSHLGYSIDYKMKNVNTRVTCGAITLGGVSTTVYPRKIKDFSAFASVYSSVGLGLQVNNTVIGR